MNLGRRLLSAALAVLALGAAWAALRPEPAPAATVTASRPAWSPDRFSALLAEAQGTVALEQAVDDLLGGIRSCVTVHEGTRPVLLRRPEAALTPASTQKILVGAAALRVLGPDFRFVTRVVATGPPRAGAAGTVWIVGSGDPLLATPEYAAHLAGRPRTKDRPLTPLDTLARRLAEAGVTTVGDIRGDDSRHDRIRAIPTWKPRYITNNEVGPLGALLVNSGFRVFTPPATRAEDPAAHAAEEFARLLRRQGVEVRGDTGSGTAPGDARSLAEVRSAPLAEVVAAMVAESDNTSAELLVRELGHRERGEGSTAAGTAAVVSRLTEMGLPLEGVEIRDGSGLEVTNAATCAVLSAALRSVEGVRELLAVTGRSGTLVERLVDTPLEGRLAAKTGSLRGVTGLAGFVDGRRKLSFALLANGDFTAAEGRLLQDRLVALLAGYPGPQPRL